MLKVAISGDVLQYDLGSLLWADNHSCYISITVLKNVPRDNHLMILDKYLGQMDIKMIVQLNIIVSVECSSYSHYDVTSGSLEFFRTKFCAWSSRRLTLNLMLWRRTLFAFLHFYHDIKCWFVLFGFVCFFSNVWYVVEEFWISHFTLFTLSPMKFFSQKLSSTEMFPFCLFSNLKKLYFSVWALILLFFNSSVWWIIQSKQVENLLIFVQKGNTEQIVSSSV